MTEDEEASFSVSSPSPPPACPHWRHVGDAVSVSAKVKKGFKFCSRILLHGQETLEDYDSCGIFGDEGNRASYRPNRARIGDDYECLWDCEWQLNPFYRSGDVYVTKLGFQVENFPMVHTSPRLPKDLTCLDDCFGFYKNPRNAGMRKKRNKRGSSVAPKDLTPSSQPIIWLVSTSQRHITLT